VNTHKEYLAERGKLSGKILLGGEQEVREGKEGKRFGKGVVFSLVPTLCVGMSVPTLCVECSSCRR
jgi:hypothetical protein